MRPSNQAVLHCGAGEPMLLIQPFMLSPQVWHGVADELSSSFEVYAPAFAGHLGGPPVRWNLTAEKLADQVERELDALGWDTCHIAGNSLGGWVGFELAKRGRARTLTAIAPAGGWHVPSLTSIEVAVKFLSLGPLLAVGQLAPSRFARVRMIQKLAMPLLAKNSGAVTRDDAEAVLTAALHCEGYLPVLLSGLRAGGITGLERITAPTQLVVCDTDRIVPASRFARRFADELPHATTTVVELTNAGHVPMLEDPHRVAELIANHISAHQPQVAAS